MDVSWWDFELFILQLLPRGVVDLSNSIKIVNSNLTTCSRSIVLVWFIWNDKV